MIFILIERKINGSKSQTQNQHNKASNKNKPKTITTNPNQYPFFHFPHFKSQITKKKKNK